MSRVVVIDLMGDDEVEKPEKEKESCEGCANCSCGKKAPGYDAGRVPRHEDYSMMLATAAYKVLWERWPEGNKR